MKGRRLPMWRALAVCALAALLAGGAAAQDKDKEKKEPQLSKGEVEALDKINKAPDAAAKLQAAGEFVKKHPKSAKRFDAASYVAGEISRVQDPAQRITLAESYLTIFTEPKETDPVRLMLMDAYMKANRLDDAFRVAATHLEKHTEDVPTLTQMALTGINEARRQNPKYAQQGNTYALKAIALIEADKKPADLDAAAWGQYKTQWLGLLYQGTGVVALMTSNKADARARLEKAVAISPDEPFNYVILGSLVDDEYQQLAQKANTQSPGPLKDEAMKQAHEKMDQVIDLYAHAMGLTEGNASYEALRQQLREPLEAYYKYRHNGSTAGLQQMIDKYKKK